MWGDILPGGQSVCGGEERAWDVSCVLRSSLGEVEGVVLLVTPSRLVLMGADIPVVCQVVVAN